MRLHIPPPELQKTKSSAALRRTSLSSPTSELHLDIPLLAALLEVEVLQCRLLRQPQRLQQSLPLASFTPIDFYLAQPQPVLIATPSFGRGLAAPQRHVAHNERREVQAPLHLFQRGFDRRPHAATASLPNDMS
jgi:hypothetical protein